MKSSFAFLIGIVYGLIALMSAVTAETNELHIAVVGPMSGQYARFGLQMRDGARQAVSDINAAGGVNVGGKQMRLKLTIGDDGCDQNRAIKLAGTFAIAEILFVAGHFCSGSSIPASHIYATEGIIQISPGSRHPALTDRRAGPNIYRLAGRDDQQGFVAGRYLAKHFPTSAIGIIHGRTAYGKKLAQDVQKALQDAGLREVYFGSFPAGEKTYYRLIGRLRRRRLDVLYLGGYQIEAALILRQMRHKGMTTQLVSGDALKTHRFWNMTGVAGEGTLFTFLPDPRHEPAAAKLVKSLNAQHILPKANLLYTYAAIQAWVQAVESASSTNLAKVMTALNTQTFKTVLGSFSFDEKGDSSLPAYSVYKWSNCALVRP